MQRRPNAGGKHDVRRKGTPTNHAKKRKGRRKYRIVWERFIPLVLFLKKLDIKSSLRFCERREAHVKYCIAKG